MMTQGKWNAVLGCEIELEEAADVVVEAVLESTKGLADARAEEVFLRAAARLIRLYDVRQKDPVVGEIALKDAPRTFREARLTRPKEGSHRRFVLDLFDEHPQMSANEVMKHSHKKSDFNHVSEANVRSTLHSLKHTGWLKQHAISGQWSRA